MKEKPDLFVTHIKDGKAVTFNPADNFSKVFCPSCGTENVVHDANEYYRCRDCRLEFKWNQERRQYEAI
jgi:hypothetical protein